MPGLTHWLLFTAGLAALVAAGVLILRSQRVGLGALPWIAVLRAAVQLAVVALLLRGVLEWWWALAAFLLLMLVTAGFTGAGRASGLPRGRAAALLGISAGAVISVGAIVGLGLVERSSQELVAIAGILIGNAMTASTLSLRRLASLLRDRRGEVEAWLALGATPTQSTAELRREAIRESLIPNLDQTRSTGLVTLPGAFVGALFGGASPLEAAAFQLVVLVGIFLGQSVTASLATWWAAGSPLLPAPDGASGA
ncbi:ABC transporter permease [Galactobacter valiniphilus]|uniref:ABC transporter permease n=1 Tax=Galactobacter valiniphilus TaxID=2676122 RepID=UPI00373639B8